MHLCSAIIFISGLIRALCTTEPHNDGFAYDEGDPLGPHHWPEKFKTCAGKYQSPIDIEENLVTRVSLAPLEMKGFNKYPESMTITNNGHTVMVTFNSSKPIKVSGGPLLSPSYKFAQFHFHWGMNDSLGSEDLINNRSYPMELHMVFYNADYNDVSIAQQANDGLVVLAFFFDVSNKDNDAYSKIVSSLYRINKPHTSIQTNTTVKLSSLVPSNLRNYFTYTGSLTTPPCTEGVRWIDFKHPIQLSHAQLEEFRKIHSDAGVLSHNFRPIQPLSSRPVWYNSGSASDVDESNAQENCGDLIINQINMVLLVFCVIVPQLY